MSRLLTDHWEWASSIIVAVIGVLISYKAYKYSKQANMDTNQLMMDKYEEALKIANQTKIDDVAARLIDAALSEYRKNGQAKTFLLNEYSRLAPEGWSKEQFEQIYKTVGFRCKGREFRQPLFDHDTYKNELQESILKEFIGASGGTCDYEKRDPPEPDFFCKDKNIYIEVTTCAYNIEIGKDTHMLQRGKIDVNRFNGNRTVILDIDNKLKDAILKSAAEKVESKHETKNFPVWLIIYADCPVHNQNEIEFLNIYIKQDKFEKIFILYKPAWPLRGFGACEIEITKNEERWVMEGAAKKRGTYEKDNQE